jgi:hypothetical protein
MKYRRLASLGGLIVLALAVKAAAQAPPTPARTATPTASKPWTAPKTPWGDPDLQGTWTSDDCIGTPMQRPVNLGEKLYLTEQEIAQRESALARQAENDKREFVAPDARVGVGPPGHWGERARRPCKQTSLVVYPSNGRIPELTPEARTRAVPQGAGNADPHPASWEDFSYYIRCITRGVTGSIFPVIYGNGAQIVQAPGFVMILHEMVHEARVIPLDGRPHASANIRTYMGDSRGHWEGKTLVIETTNFLGNKTGIGLNGGGTPTSDALKLTERYTRTGLNTIDYEVTIDDPKTYTGRWQVAFPITQEPGYQNFEYACHEGNHAMFNSLSGARAEERAADEAAKKK